MDLLSVSDISLVDSEENEEVQIKKQEEKDVREMAQRAAFYEVLGISADATKDEIIEAYSTILLNLHSSPTKTEHTYQALLEVQQAVTSLITSCGEKKIYLEDSPENEKLRKDLYEHINHLAKANFQSPPEPLLSSFVDLVIILTRSPGMQTLFDKLPSTSTMMKSSYNLFCVMFALGPLVIGPVDLWREVFEKTDESTNVLLKTHLSLLIEWISLIVGLCTFIPAVLNEHVVNVFKQVPAYQLKTWLSTPLLPEPLSYILVNESLYAPSSTLLSRTQTQKTSNAPSPVKIVKSIVLPSPAISPPADRISPVETFEEPKRAVFETNLPLSDLDISYIDQPVLGYNYDAHSSSDGFISPPLRIGSIDTSKNSLNTNSNNSANLKANSASIEIEPAMPYVAPVQKRPEPGVSMPAVVTPSPDVLPSVVLSFASTKVLNPPSPTVGDASTPTSQNSETPTKTNSQADPSQPQPVEAKPICCIQ